MPIITASDEDEALLDGIERSIMRDWESLEIRFERIGLPGSSYSWQVAYKHHGMYDDEKGKHCVYAGGGGHTLREAMHNALVGRVVKALDK